LGTLKTSEARFLEIPNIYFRSHEEQRNVMSYRGSMVAIATPMTFDGAVDFETLGHLLDWHIEQGTDAIVAVGTTGESATLDHDEHRQVIRFCIDHVKGRLPIIAGTGSNSTKEAIELTRAAESMGAAAALLVTPYYNKPTQEGLYQHYAAVAAAVKMPIMLYNVPGRTAVDLLPETVARLSQIHNIIGIKDATGNLQRLTQMKSICREGFEFYSGDDATAIEFILQGGQGGISVTANVAPKQLAQAYHAALEGNAELARQLDAPLQALHRDLFVEANPIPVKWALYRMGKINRGIRLPLTELSVQHHATIEAALAQAYVLNYA
jgi:4-hydroxy-tetrahydrodipicolinate synthase